MMTPAARARVVETKKGEAMHETETHEVEITGLEKQFAVRKGKSTSVVHALHDVCLTVDKGEFVTIIGPSGCGKSTLLECAAGLTLPGSGTIKLGGVTVHGPNAHRVVVFQSASLLPWRTVQRNIAYGAELARWPAARIRESVKTAIDLVGLGGFEQHYPHQLSGGMQQRANLARALVMDAEVILMDEPFGALDSMTKRAMQDELLSLHAKLGRTVVFITHDLDEAIYLGDRVVVMKARPGEIKSIVDVPFERPRPREIVDSPEFRALAHDLDVQLGRH
jgi:NitT/TauT family transport system ATP-binding protein